MRNQYSDSGDYVRNRRTKLVKITTRLASIVDIRSSDWRSRVDTSRKTKGMIEKDGISTAGHGTYIWGLGAEEVHYVL